MQNLWIGLYLVTVALLDWWAYRKLNKRWKRRERARTVAGVVLVIAPALALGVVGVFDLLTILTIFTGFGVAGMVTIYLDIQHETEEADNLRREVFRAQSD